MRRVEVRISHREAKSCDKSKCFFVEKSRVCVKLLEMGVQAGPWPIQSKVTEQL